jgi:hypothetical protein
VRRFGKGFRSSSTSSVRSCCPRRWRRPKRFGDVEDRALLIKNKMRCPLHSQAR